MRKTICKTLCFLSLLFCFGVFCEAWAVCDHNYTLITHKEPTCTAEGKNTYLCSCGTVYTETLSLAGHSFVLSDETKSTYGKSGVKIYVCSVCGAGYSETTDALTLTAVKGIRVVSYSASAVKIAWSSVEGAERYEVSGKISGGEWQAQSTDNLSLTFKELKGASLYFFRVRAVCGENGGSYSETVSCYTKPEAVSLKEAVSKTDSLTVSWTKSEGASGYQILYTEDKNFDEYKKVTVSGGDTLKKTISSLSESTVYYVKIRPYITVDSEKIYGAFSDAAEEVTLPSAVSVSKTSSTDNSVTVKWKEAKGVSGYYLEYSSSKSFSSAETVKVSAAEYTVKNLTSCKTYYFRVRAFKTLKGENYCGDYSDIQSVTVKPAAVSFTDFVRESEKITVRWIAAENVSGYEIKYSQKKNLSGATTLTVSGASACKKTVTSLTSATSYYFKIRAYKTVNGEKIYGGYSSVKRVTTSPAKVKTENVKAGEGKFVVTWEKVSGADSYQVTYSSSENFKKSKTVTVKDTAPLKKTFKNLSKGTVYYVKVRACKTVGGKRIYGQYSQTLEVRTKLGTVKVKSAAADTDSLALSWNKVSSADGYEIIYATYSSFSDGQTVKVKGENSLKKTVKNLSCAESYYIKIRAYKTVNNEKVYGEYSDRLKITTLPQKVNVTKAEKKNASTVKIYWSAVPNVSGYEVVYSDNSDFTKAVGITVSGQATTSRLIKELKAGKTYCFRIRAYKTVDGKKIYGEYGQVKSVKV